MAMGDSEVLRLQEVAGAANNAVHDMFDLLAAQDDGEPRFVEDADRARLRGALDIISEILMKCDGNEEPDFPDGPPL